MPEEYARMSDTKREWIVCNCNGTYTPTADIHILDLSGKTEIEQCIATLSYEHKDIAPLIAAAPALYEALKETRFWVSQRHQLVLEMIDKALVKAEG